MKRYEANRTLLDMAKALNNVGVELAGPSSNPGSAAEISKVRAVYERWGIESPRIAEALAVFGVADGNPTTHRPEYMGIGAPRTFDLVRLVDATGISGTGTVAEGCVFNDGTTALRWLTGHRSTAVYESAREVLAIHGHGGQTELRYHGSTGFDGRACSNCAHPWGAHEMDGSCICCCGGCSCCLMEHPEFKPIGKDNRG